MADHANHNTVHNVVGVYADPMIARGVARQIADLGVPQSSIAVGDAAGDVQSLKAEMREEADNTIIGPGNVGPFTKRMTKGLIRQTIGWTIGLAILGCALAFFDWPASNLAFGQRLLIAAIVGAVTGATIGFVWGGARGAANEPSLHGLAAERGITLTATIPASLAPEAVRIMREAQPIRLDLGTPEGSPVETITTEEDVNR
ncbi:MAG TPA: hypothetical protein VM345_12940 [Acidimicrobiales bacterium]|jgi:hypothetical protein|nr:hypothetical protein [Acidimicrobiales bacterium]